MKQIAQNYRSGELLVVDAPAPVGRPGGLLVQSEFSLISTGTELMKVGEAKLSFLGKARARPDQVRKVLESVATQGPQSTVKKVMNRLDSLTPLGYSLCGRVVEVGAGVSGYSVGQRVVCAGNQYALHAELNWVPVQLCAPVPDGVDPRHAAFSTVGAIAMHGVRQAGLGLGETAVVIGLGLVGQLVVQLLRASGVNVLGVDFSEDRCRLAEGSGARLCSTPDGDSMTALRSKLADFTDGHGADAVLISAGGDTADPVTLAAELARDRARVVDIGKTLLHLPYVAYFEKELELRFSRSYGPGRYDPSYEEDGVDYPIGYVRWTEGRNLRSFVELLADGRIDLTPLVTEVVPFADALSTYQRLESGELRSVGVLFEYDSSPTLSRQVEAAKTTGTTGVPTRATTGIVRFGFVGCGNYASTMLAPHLKNRPDVELRHVVTSTALSAVSAQTKFGFTYAGTEIDVLLDDPKVDVVVIATRHESHAAQTVRALRAGKAVFVEKPLAIDRDGLTSILDTIAETGNDRLTVGFNRRFSPLLTELKQHSGAAHPSMMRYLVNAGRLDKGSWINRRDIQGSRFVGEAGHFIDVMAWWTHSEPVAVTAVRTSESPDDLQAIIQFADGSSGQLAYATSGSAKFPKETFDVMAGARSARLDNFRTATSWGAGRPWRKRALTPDKGQAEQMAVLIDVLRSGRPMPIALATLVSVTEATLAIEEAADLGVRVPLGAGARRS